MCYPNEKNNYESSRVACQAVLIWIPYALSALKSWLQLILAKYDINGNYSSYIKATSTKLAIIIVRPSVNKLQHFVAMETVT